MSATVTRMSMRVLSGAEVSNAFTVPYERHGLAVTARRAKSCGRCDRVNRGPQRDCRMLSDSTRSDTLAAPGWVNPHSDGFLPRIPDDYRSPYSRADDRRVVRHRHVQRRVRA
jgi:hypothetical protein